LILIFAVVLSTFLQEATPATIILTIVLISGLLEFWQEQGASNGVEKLLALVQVKATHAINDYTFTSYEHRIAH
jgi:Mg2+-importing ATPase